jgi:hypothetical protein
MSRPPLLVFAPIILATATASAQPTPPEEPTEPEPTESPQPSEADDACVDAFGQAQIDRDDGALLAAKQALVTCAQPECPTIVRQQCKAWLPSLDASIPTIVVAADDGRGSDIVEAELWVDGKQLAAKLDGHAIALDPGPHDLRVIAPGGLPEHKSVVLYEGAKNRIIHFELPPEPQQREKKAPTRQESTDEMPPIAIAGWSLVGLAGASLAAGVVAGAISISQTSDLEERCAVACEQEEIDDAHVVAHVSTTGFALAGAAAVVGLTLLGVHWAREDDTVGVAISGTHIALFGRFD